MEERNRILVVDDDHMHLDMIEEIISEYYDATLAASGAQALELLQKSNIPDLILLDIIMPNMDGYETFERICGIETLSGVPVIFLTGMSGSEAELAGLKLGAQDYITKPFVRENLLARIRLRLESGKQARQLQLIRERMLEAGIDEERFTVSTLKLTSTEQEVARLIALGCGNQEIAIRLSYSQGYIKNLATMVYDKLHVQNRWELRKMFQCRATTRNCLEFT
ncbi:MAG: response regulator [Oscillospiraceae bacterium]|nr:response regulator [Oscillospiraceae bacterium]